MSGGYQPKGGHGKPTNPPNQGSGGRKPDPNGQIVPKGPGVQVFVGGEVFWYMIATQLAEVLRRHHDWQQADDVTLCFGDDPATHLSVASCYVDSTMEVQTSAALSAYNRALSDCDRVPRPPSLVKTVRDSGDVDR